MAKLHELLAAESNVAAAYNTVADETIKVLARPELFTAETATVTHFAEADKNLDTSQTRDNVTTVSDRLTYSLGKAFQGYVNLLLAKDRTNQDARATVEVNGAMVLEDISAQGLLTLEKVLAGLRAQFKDIPTLQAGPVWDWDAGKGMHRTHEPAVTFKTRKTVRPVVMSPATDKHPAQIERVTEDEPVAKIERSSWSGMWTSRQKHELLSRLDTLLVEVKTARQRANRTDVVRQPVAEQITAYLLNGIVEV